jgi:hypothetical protein
MLTMLWPKNDYKKEGCIRTIHPYFIRLPEGDNIIHQVIGFILETSRNIIVQQRSSAYPSGYYLSGYGQQYAR